jgi:hypothetical protein
MSAGLRHHLTARGVVGALIAVVAVAAAMIWFATWFKSDPSLSEWWVPIEAFGPLLAVIAAARTLAGVDVPLERSTPRQRPAVRTAHVLAGLVLCAVPTAVAASTVLHAEAVTATIRNGAGLFGLALFTSTVLRAGAVWMPASGYVLLVVAGAPRGTGHGEIWWAWFVQPGSTVMTWAIAMVLLAVGAVAYMRRGPAV